MHAQGWRQNRCNGTGGQRRRQTPGRAISAGGFAISGHHRAVRDVDDRRIAELTTKLIEIMPANAQLRFAGRAPLVVT